MENKRDAKGLIKALTHKDAEIRKDAALALSRLRDPLALEPLIRKLIRSQKDDSPDVRWAAAVALGELQDPLVAEALILATYDSSTSVRIAAAQGLKKQGDERAIEELVDALSDANADLREIAAYALDSLDWKPGTDKNAAWYWFAKRQYQECVDIGLNAVEPMLVMLKTGTSDARKQAAQALVNIYKTKGLNPATKAKILQVRPTITEPVTLIRHDDFERYGDCGAHTDEDFTKGLGVDFPL